jgi:AcrR family transcriptional regulator
LFAGLCRRTPQDEEDRMTADAAQPAQAARPLRRDAERNRKRIIVAAREVFTTRGLDASLDEVARHAGVGVGTVYRRFADKEALVDALFADRVDELAAIAERWLAEPDPWLALVSFLHEWVDEQAGDLGLRQMLMFATYGGASRFGVARMRFAPLVGALVGRAKAAGVVRADLEPTDVPFIALMLSTAAEYAQDSAPDIWRRYLTMFIDGISVSRDGTTPLPVSALPATEMERAIRMRATARANAKT